MIALLASNIVKEYSYEDITRVNIAKRTIIFVKISEKECRLPPKEKEIVW